MDAIDALDARVRDYRLKHPRRSAHVGRLACRGYVRGVPLDPTNTPYVFTPAGRVTIARESKLLPLPGQSARRRADADADRRGRHRRRCWA